MKTFYDCNNLPYPVFAQGCVSDCKAVEGAKPEGSVYLLKVILPPQSQIPAPGQFYMLHPERSNVLLGRPISVYHSERLDGGTEIHFLILVKGKGTQELCSLMKGDKINLLGPCGNRFEAPVAATEFKV